MRQDSLILSVFVLLGFSVSQEESLDLHSKVIGLLLRKVSALEKDREVLFVISLLYCQDRQPIVLQCCCHSLQWLAEASSPWAKPVKPLQVLEIMEPRPYAWGGLLFPKPCLNSASRQQDTNCPQFGQMCCLQLLCSITSSYVLMQ